MRPSYRIVIGALALLPVASVIRLDAQAASTSRFSVAVRGGMLAPSAAEGILAKEVSTLTLEAGDLRAFLVGVEASARLTPRIEAHVGIDRGSRTVPSATRTARPGGGAAIEQTTTLEAQSLLSLGGRFYLLPPLAPDASGLWQRRRLSAFVSGGVAQLGYAFSIDGEFLDEAQSLPFTATYESSGSGRMPYYGGGIGVAVRDDIDVTVEVRLQDARPPVASSLANWGHLDLSGSWLAIGLTRRLGAPKLGAAGSASRTERSTPAAPCTRELTRPCATAEPIPEPAPAPAPAPVPAPAPEPVPAPTPPPADTSPVTPAVPAPVPAAPVVAPTVAPTVAPSATRVADILSSSAVFTLEGLTFPPGKAVIPDRSYGDLDVLAEALRANPDVRVEVSGHTDNVGPAATNLAVSQARAEAVRAYLVDHGVASSQIVARGYGSSRPITGNDTPEGQTRNRRVEVVRLSR